MKTIFLHLFQILINLKKLVSKLTKLKTKNMSKQNNQNGLIVGLLGVAFVVLKLCKVIDWNWWLVTIPFWGAISIGIVFFIITLIIGLFAPKKPESEPRLKSNFQKKLEEMEEHRKLAKYKNK